MKKIFLFFPCVVLLSLLFGSCEKEISYETGGVPVVITDSGSVGGTAKYSFNGGTATCSGAVLSGTFTAGVAATGANTVKLKVSVDSTGTYTVTTSAVNGVSFSGSGTFSFTGVQDITLAATGTPTVGGTFNFTTGSGGCTFSVTVNAAPINITGNFKAKIDGVQWVADKYAQGARMNGIINLSGLGLDKKVITMTLQDSGVHQYTLYYDGTVADNAGAYTDSNSTSSIAFTSNAGLAPNESGGVVNITSINEANKTMSGTFSFKAKRAVDNTYKTITEGVFTNLSYITSLPPTSSSDTFNVKIDGAAFVPTSVNGIVVSIPSSSISITGSDASGTKTVAVYLPADITTGTYTIGSAFSSYYGQYNVNSSTFLISTTGTLEILFHDPATKRIRGRFSYAAEPFLVGGTPVQLTEGYFAVTYL